MLEPLLEAGGKVERPEESFSFLFLHVKESPEIPKTLNFSPKGKSLGF